MCDAAVIERIRAGVRLLDPDDITPAGKRVLEKILDAASQQARCADREAE